MSLGVWFRPFLVLAGSAVHLLAGFVLAIIVSYRLSTGASSAAGWRWLELWGCIQGCLCLYPGHLSRAVSALCKIVCTKHAWWSITLSSSNTCEIL